MGMYNCNVGSCLFTVSLPSSSINETNDCSQKARLCTRREREEKNRLYWIKNPTEAAGGPRRIAHSPTILGLSSRRGVPPTSTRAGRTAGGPEGSHPSVPRGISPPSGLPGESRLDPLDYLQLHFIVS